VTSGCFAVVTGGGTAGHVLPAIAVAEGLAAAGHDPATIHYVGSTRGIERRLLPDTPFATSVEWRGNFAWSGCCM
jgi:UDP-N-acetylglucosamine:LPS N-acetylglucosamine transferase